MLAPWRGQDDLPTHDALLLYAYAMHKASLCESCGRVRDECRDPSVKYRVDDSGRCRSTAALQEWRKANPNPDPGVVLQVVVDDGKAQSSQAALLAAARAAEAARA